MLNYGGTLQWGAALSQAEAESEELLRPREADYGSAAALLVRRADFVQLVEFDPIFEPAHFEEVDLQLRLRKISVSVWFEPPAITVFDNLPQIDWAITSPSGERMCWRQLRQTTISAVTPPSSNLGNATRPQPQARQFSRMKLQ